jgi:hypothetical protein
MEKIRQRVVHLRVVRPSNVVLMVLAPALSGCAAGISTGVSEPVRPFQPIVVSSLALMPVTMYEGSEGLRPDVVATLLSALRERFPDVGIVDVAAAGGRLASGPAARECASLLADYERTGVADAMRVASVTRALGVTHFLAVRVGYESERRMPPFTNFDRTQGINSERRQAMVAVARLWSEGGAGPLWEAVAHTDSETSWRTTARRPFELVADLVVSLVEHMPLADRAAVSPG